MSARRGWSGSVGRTMVDVWARLEPHLASVQKPARYIGCELCAEVPPPAPHRVGWLLVYPDTYEIGLPNQGLQILYEILNERPDARAERTYAPWTDLEEVLRRENIPLFSVDTHRSADEFDVLAMDIGEEGKTIPVSVEGVLLRSPQEEYDTPARRAHDILGRLQRLIGMVRTAVGILPAPEGVTGDRDGIRTLGLGINRAFMADGVVDLRGQQIETADDLATLAQVFRDPSIETLRIFYTKNKQVVGQEGISSRLPGSIDVFVSEAGKTIPASTFFNTMRQRMEALGAARPR